MSGENLSKRKIDDLCQDVWPIKKHLKKDLPMPEMMFVSMVTKGTQIVVCTLSTLPSKTRRCQIRLKFNLSPNTSSPTPYGTEK